VANLKKEGVSSDIFVKNVGDVMLDVSQFFAKKLTPPPGKSAYVLCTIHRQENVDDLSRLTEIVKALNLLSEQINIVLPLHPRTKKMIENRGLKFHFATIEPAGYMEMMSFLQYCEAVITDSGGLQKEAYFFKKPCITMRDETEWVELVQNGVNLLVGASSDKILGAFHSLKTQKLDFNAPLYGSGNASELILDSLVSLSHK
ncbi:UDP-N-acetyl glucosamine 2-epimerase, partial [bacterium]|nr:UDP-N-acetyl glucosamine 2-epimerase [bacterium]